MDANALVAPKNFSPRAAFMAAWGLTIVILTGCQQSPGVHGTEAVRGDYFQIPSLQTPSNANEVSKSSTSQSVLMSAVVEFKSTSGEADRAPASAEPLRRQVSLTTERGRISQIKIQSLSESKVTSSASCPLERSKTLPVYRWGTNVAKVFTCGGAKDSSDPDVVYDFVVFLNVRGTDAVIQMGIKIKEEKTVLSGHLFPKSEEVL